ncbi:MAG: extracellular solute-binding protein [Nitrososphaerales archaeon]
MVSRVAIVGIIAGVLIVASVVSLLFSMQESPETEEVITEGAREVTLTGLFAEPKGRWDMLLEHALEELMERHPEIDIKIDYRVLPYAETKRQILTAMAGQTSIDLISVDVIWLGEFTEGGFLTDLTERAGSWGRSSDWYEANWAGGLYNDRVYGIWAWTDIRAMWYWKDLLMQADVDPDSFKTWDGYIASAKRINNELGDQAIQAMHLVGANHSPDMWYPYLWMLGGDILEAKDRHPTKDLYWYPAYHGKEGIRALEFLRQQVNAGIKPQVSHFWGQEFTDKKFAVMLEGSWLLGNFPKEQLADIEQRVGMIPMFPVPEEGMQSATMMGGWIVSIPETSNNKDLAWELLTLMVDPETLAPMLHQFGYLPTQKPLGEGAYAKQLSLSIPYYDEMISMIAIGHSRPSIAEYPQIAEHIRQAIDEVYFGVKDPEQALKDAAEKSAKVLGW